MSKHSQPIASQKNPIKHTAYRHLPTCYHQPSSTAQCQQVVFLPARRRSCSCPPAPPLGRAVMWTPPQSGRTPGCSWPALRCQLRLARPPWYSPACRHTAGGPRARSGPLQSPACRDTSCGGAASPGDTSWLSHGDWPLLGWTHCSSAAPVTWGALHEINALHSNDCVTPWHGAQSSHCKTFHTTQLSVAGSSTTCNLKDLIEKKSNIFSSI